MKPSPASSESETHGERPVVAFVTNSLTPYWVHLYLRFARELGGVRVVTCGLFEQADQPWSISDVRELNYVCVGAGEGSCGRGLGTILADWRKGGRVIRWLQESNARVAVVGGYADVGRARIIAWCHREGIPVLLYADSNVRAPRPMGLRGIVKEWFFRVIFPMIRGVLVCGRNGADYFTSYNYPGEQIFICPVEPDYALIQSLTTDDVLGVLAKFGLEPDRKRLVACSRHIEVKRVDLAIDAFAAIAEERPEWDLVIVGGGPLHEALKGRVPVALRDRVKFLGFVGDQREVSGLYRGSHVLVHAAEYEPFGLVIPEAVAAGMAVVCSSVVGAAPEVVAEGVNGRYFPVGNLRLLVAAMRDVTEAGRTERYRTNSPVLLADWRGRGDPVQGIGEAFASVGFDPHKGDYRVQREAGAEAAAARGVARAVGPAGV